MQTIKNAPLIEEQIFQALNTKPKNTVEENIENAFTDRYRLGDIYIDDNKIEKDQLLSIKNSEELISFYQDCLGSKENFVKKVVSQIHQVGKVYDVLQALVVFFVENVFASDKFYPLLKIEVDSLKFVKLADFQNKLHFEICFSIKKFQLHDGSQSYFLDDDGCGIECRVEFNFVDNKDLDYPQIEDPILVLDVNGDKAKDFIVSDDEIKDHVALSKSSKKLDDLLNNKRLLKDDLSVQQRAALLYSVPLLLSLAYLILLCLDEKKVIDLDIDRQDIKVAIFAVFCVLFCGAFAGFAFHAFNSHDKTHQIKELDNDIDKEKEIILGKLTTGQKFNYLSFDQKLLGFKGFLQNEFKEVYVKADIDSIDKGHGAVDRNLSKHLGVGKIASKELEKKISGFFDKEIIGNTPGFALKEVKKISGGARIQQL